MMPRVWPWLVMAAILICFGFGFAAAWDWQASRVEAVELKYSTFVATTKANGEAALAFKEKTDAENKTAKKETDASYTSTLAAQSATIASLRNARAASSFLPPAPPTARSPDTACFDRAAFERALQQFDSETSGVVDEGDEARAGLNAAKGWAAISH